VIYVSTGGYFSRSAIDTAFEYLANGIVNVELSGGAYSADVESELLKLKGRIDIQLHNYYPPPSTPFVFNLASENREIAEKSLLHARNAIRLSELCGRGIYGFHAGFRIDPDVDELGKSIGFRKLFDAKRAEKIFFDRVACLAAEAKQAGVSLLIENNVLTSRNLNIYKENPLLFTTPEQITNIMKMMPSNVGLLLDVAHLKVSSKTLGFDLLDGHERLRPWIRGYHLSDNDGSIDSNDVFTRQSWFWPCIIKGLNYYTIEVYKTSIAGLVQQRDLAAEMLAL